MFVIFKFFSMIFFLYNCSLVQEHMLELVVFLVFINLSLSFFLNLIIVKGPLCCRIPHNIDVSRVFSWIDLDHAFRAEYHRNKAVSFSMNHIQMHIMLVTSLLMTSLRWSPPGFSMVKLWFFHLVISKWFVWRYFETI